VSPVSQVPPVVVLVGHVCTLVDVGAASPG
jgi:hypothetical protein